MSGSVVFVVYAGCIRMMEYLREWDSMGYLDDVKVSEYRRIDIVSQGMMCVLAILMACGLVFGTDVEDNRRGKLGHMIQALLGKEGVESDLWLWIARISLAALVLLVVWYLTGPARELKRISAANRAASSEKR